MPTFKTRSEEKALTLAFEKSATRETKVFHPWRYYVAGGETLAKIEEIIADFAGVDQAAKDLAAKYGAKSFDTSYGFTFDFDGKDMQPLKGTERVDYNLQGGKGGQPWQDKIIPSIPDFVVSDGRSYGQFHPDVSTERGQQIRADMIAVKEKAQPMVRFAKWLGADGVKVIPDPTYQGQTVNASATATKIGNEWIIAVPVAITYDSGYPAKNYTEEWSVPPGSQPLAVSEYFAKAEKANLVQNAPKP